MQLWETADDERIRRLRSVNYVGVSGVVVVFDLANADSFQNLHTHFTEVDRNTNDSVKRFLVGNKCDLVCCAVVEVSLLLLIFRLPFIYLFVYLFIYLFIYLFVCLFVFSRLFIHSICSISDD
jgi:hypothetical protein